VLLSDLLSPDRVVVPMAAHEKRAALQELTRVLVERAGGSYRDVLGAVEERESVMSTGIGLGVAIPHGRSPTVQELALVCGVTDTPVAFEALDGEPVRLFFLVVGPESSAGLHVKVLSRIARLVRHDALRTQLVAAHSPREFYDALIDAEAR